MLQWDNNRVECNGRVTLEHLPSMAFCWLDVGLHLESEFIYFRRLLRGRATQVFDNNSQISVGLLELIEDIRQSVVASDVKSCTVSFLALNFMNHFFIHIQKK